MRRDEGTLTYDDKRKRWIGRAYVQTATGQIRKQVSDPDRKACARKLETLIREAHAGLITPSVSLGRYLAAWRERKAPDLASSTLAAYDRVLPLIDQALGHLPLNELRTGQVQAALRELRGWNAKTFRAVLRNALNDAIREDLIQFNPAEKAQPPKAEPRPKVALTPEAVVRIIDMEPNPVRQALWTFMALQGARTHSEAASLRWSQIMEADGLLWYRGAKTAQGRQLRPIDPRLVPVLRSIQTESDFVFPSRAGTQITRENLIRAWGQACDRAEVPRCRPYSLRSFAASQLAREGISLANIAQYLGHADTAVTARYYLANTTDELANAIKKRAR